MSDPPTARRQDSLRRWCVFNLVGAMGIVLQIASLSLFRGLLGLHYMLATAFAVECTILHNFIWHERWTWVDRCSSHDGDSFRRLLRFNLGTGTVSITSNLVFMGLLVDGLGLHYIAANLLSIAFSSVVNFAVSDRFVFLSSEQRSKSPATFIRHRIDDLLTSLAPENR